MWDELRDRIAVLLNAATTGVFCAVGNGEPSGVVIQYQCRGCELDCLLPRWVDVSFYIEERPQVMLMIALDEHRWLRYLGRVRLIDSLSQIDLAPARQPPGWPDHYVVARIVPKRIDLLDEREWGALETLEFA